MQEKRQKLVACKKPASNLKKGKNLKKEKVSQEPASNLKKGKVSKKGNKKEKVSKASANLEWWVQMHAWGLENAELQECMFWITKTLHFQFADATHHSLVLAIWISMQAKPIPPQVLGQVP